VRVAGKTGTAQVSKMGEKRLKPEELPYELRDHAWFVAYAPADDPKIAVAVLVEHGGHGGSAAAPLAREVIKKWLEIVEGGG
ncbi:MAG: penicillin-binding protein 2, partial [Deltaproteobacteria bacterium]